MSILITPTSPYSSDRKNVEPLNGSDYTREELHELLDTNIIERIVLDDKHMFLIDEEGKLKEKMVNNDATYFLRKYHKTNDFIAGNALFCKISELK